ncbi:hypothetical protein [Longimicrobium sp.]|uniref:hypothetical protein n=1 Tax=Longimicrobium sp. TaxID=2029185 RepID=UPI002E37A597|nr:hypothetical protein [Longimicrobium sp.]HEX6039893.1 hypothetical protein [Longimicrobium sp.]
MSVSLVMLPVALAMRVVMGKESFEEWLRSNEARVTTELRSQAELLRTVRSAGYDADDWGGLIKTHIDGEKEFMWWRMEDGKWIAIFSKFQVPAISDRFIQDLEAKTGRRIFVREDAPPAAAVAERERTSIYPTNFRDGTLLMETLERFGIQAQVQADGSITAALGRSPVVFRPAGETAPYSVEIGEAPDLRGTFEQLSRVDEAYKQGVQGAALATLRERIRGRNMKIEREEVLEDRSVLLTLTIGGG